MQHSVTSAKVYLHTEWHVDASSRLAIIEMGQKWGCGSFWGEDLYPHVAQRI